MATHGIYIGRENEGEAKMSRFKDKSMLEAQDFQINVSLLRVNNRLERLTFQI